MSSSTSSSERRRPAALLGAIALVLAVEWIVSATAPSFMESQPLIYEAKLGALQDTLRGDLVFLGDSTAVAAARPEDFDGAVPPGVRVVNLALPGSGPVVGEWLMRRYLRENPERARLAVLAFSSLSFTDWRTNFVEYPLTHLLPWGPVWRAARAQRDYGYLLEWTATRLATLRYREEMKSGLLSLLFDRWPGLGDLYRRLTGDELRDQAFAWHYTRRAERNRRLVDELLGQRGWRLFREMHMGGGRLADEVRFDRGPFRFPPFAAAERERRALARLLDLCAEQSIRVLVLPAAQPRALTRALDRRGGALRLDAFSEQSFGGRAGVEVPLGLRMPWPHRFFGDLAHVNEDGRRRYTEAVLPEVREAAARVEWAPAPRGFVYSPPAMSDEARAEVEAALRRFFAERSGGELSEEAIDPAAHVFDAGYVDSMNSLSLLDFIEERWGVSVPEVDLVGNLDTLAAIAEYVAARAGAR